MPFYIRSMCGIYKANLASRSLDRSQTLFPRTRVRCGQSPETRVLKLNGFLRAALFILRLSHGRYERPLLRRNRNMRGGGGGRRVSIPALRIWSLASRLGGMRHKGGGGQATPDPLTHLGMATTETSLFGRGSGFVQIEYHTVGV